MAEKIRVFHPMGYPPKITQRQMAPRLDTLNGKTIYLVDMRFDDSDLLLEQIEAWFKEHMPQVNTVFRRKAGVYTQEDPALFEEIRQKGDGAILANGFRPGESVVSLFTGVRSTAYNLGLREKHWRDHVINMLRGINPHLAPTLVLDPITARQFIDRGGFDTKEKLIDWIHEHATLPAGIYWDHQLIQNYVYPRALNGEEPYATRLKAAEDAWIRVFRRQDIHVVVVGGETNGYWRIMGCKYVKSVPIDPWR